MSLKEQTQQLINSWLNGPFDELTKKQIRSLLTTDPQSLHDSFSSNLAFGTGGVRGLMGVGPNRMNIYTIGLLTQGLANYLLRCHSTPIVLIGYDTRHHSEEFAKRAACVLAANQITVLLFETPHPTPLVSFGAREKKCSAAIMITASHNPPEYNGYKVYWKDGAQVTNPHDENIIEEMKKISYDDVLVTDFANSSIIIEKNEIDIAYLKELSKHQSFPKQNQEKGPDLHLIYSNLHGTGIEIVPRALSSWGFTQIDFVENQKELNGDFPGAPNPNPERKETLESGIDDLVKKKADLFLTTDPDADRMAAVTLHKNKPIILTGNQIASILLYSLCKNGKNLEQMSVVSTIVTTPLLQKICNFFNLKFFEVLTGFKYIAEKIREWEKEKVNTFLFGAEESYGYLKGDFVRDKDGVEASCLLSEIALDMKLQKKTLVDLLEEIYSQFGVHVEAQRSLNFSPDEQGMNQMLKIMETIRANPGLLSHTHFTSFDDYLKKKGDLPLANVLSFHFKTGKIILRPSGTEPKLKLYGFYYHPLRGNFEEDSFNCLKELNTLLNHFENLAKEII